MKTTKKTTKPSATKPSATKPSATKPSATKPKRYPYCYGKLNPNHLAVITVAHLAAINARPRLAEMAAEEFVPTHMHVCLAVENALDEIGVKVLHVTKAYEGHAATLAIVRIDGLVWEIIENCFYLAKPRTHCVAWEEVSK